MKAAGQKGLLTGLRLKPGWRPPVVPLVSDGELPALKDALRWTFGLAVFERLGRGVFPALTLPFMGEVGLPARE